MFDWLSCLKEEVFEVVGGVYNAEHLTKESFDNSVNVTEMTSAVGR